MDYRDSYRSYDRPSGYDDAAATAPYKHPIEDAFDRSRKRGRSPSPTFDRYASERRTSGYGSFPPAAAPETWERERDLAPPPERSPYAAGRGLYDDYPPPRAGADPYDRERERALEWERYYRERDPGGYGDDYGTSDRDRYESRRRYDDDVDVRGGRDDRYYRERDRGFAAYGDGAVGTPQRRGGPDYSLSSSGTGGAYRNGADPTALPDPLQSETLLPFRVFAQMTKAAHPSARDRTIDQPTTQELYEGYQAYRLAFSKKAMTAFFDVRKDEAWFKEKYSAAPEYTAARQKRKRTARAGKKEAWLDELASGKLDSVSFDLRVATEADVSASRGADGGGGEDDERGNGRRSADAHDEYAEPDGRDDQSHRRRVENLRVGDPILTTRYGEAEPVPGEQVTIPTPEHQILVKSFPPDISRFKVEEHLQSQPGYRYLALGEPHSGKKWHRVGWAMYEAGTDMEETVRALDGKDIDGFNFHMAHGMRPTSGKLRSAPEYSNSFERLLQDLKQVKALVAKFEDEDRTVLFREEAEDGAAWLLNSASDAIMARHRELEPEVDEALLEQGFDAEEQDDRREARRSRLKKHLDWHLDLLRTVYSTDYYLSLVCEFQEELLRRSPRHARRQPPPGTLYESPKDNTNDESWARSVDSKTALLLTGEKADLAEWGGKSIDAELMAAALPFVKEEEKEKHRCIVEVAGAQCGKLFKAAIFVQKHVLNKHRAFLEAQAEDSMLDTKFFNNFVRDPCRPQAPPGQPVSAAGLAGTPLSQRFGGLRDGGTPGAPSPLFNQSRVGLIRLGAAIDSPASVSSYGGGGGGRRGPDLGDRIGGVAAAPPMSMTGVYASPSSSSLSMRIGGMAPNGGTGPTRMGASDAPKLPAEPLPDPPKPLDPRAARADPRTYTDLDGPAAQGDVDDLAY